MTATAESQVYRDLIRFKPDGLSPNAWAVKAGVSRTVWSDMRRHGNPSRRTLEKLLVAAGSSLAEFEALRVGPQSERPAVGVGLADSRRGWASAALPSLPVVASGLAGEWGEPGSEIELTEIRPREVLERMARPVSLASDPDAFALTVVGDAMWPRFRPGARIAVAPRSPVAIGDDVLVRVRSPDAADRVLIKQLIKRTASGLELRQFNPGRTFAVRTEEIEAILRIPGELI
ncbi:MAG: helix-turn-helix transcriptional regulator [Sphingomicrobium sp.]